MILNENRGSFYFGIFDYIPTVEEVMEADSTICGGSIDIGFTNFVGVGCSLNGGESYNLFVVADADSNGRNANLIIPEGTQFEIQSKY